MTAKHSQDWPGLLVSAQAALAHGLLSTGMPCGWSDGSIHGDGGPAGAHSEEP